MNKNIGKKEGQNLIEKINDLEENQVNEIKLELENLKKNINKERFTDTIRYCKWIDEKVKLNLKAKKYFNLKMNDSKHMHQIRPRRGEVYLTELGQNIGAEINERHLALILQNNKGNLYADTVVVIPISSSGKLHQTHEKIENVDILKGKLDKLPSKAKTEQIHYIDKARLIHYVATLTPDCIDRICKRLKKNLAI